MFQLLDSLAQLEQSSRSRIINTALWQYAEDYLGVRGRTVKGSLTRRLRRIDTLQRRIEVNLQLGKKRRMEDLQEDRKDMLDETYQYARYTANTASYRLLSRAACWLAHTFENVTPAPEILTGEVKALLKALIDAEDKNPETEKVAK